MATQANRSFNPADTCPQRSELINFFLLLNRGIDPSRELMASTSDLQKNVLS